MGSQNKGENVKLRHLGSTDDTAVANILMSTSLSLGVDFSTSLNSRTSGDPYGEVLHLCLLIQFPRLDQSLVFFFLVF
ncbi:hypothetical protein ES703_10334 [subsurface metagenome]